MASLRHFHGEMKEWQINTSSSTGTYRWTKLDSSRKQNNPQRTEKSKTGQLTREWHPWAQEIPCEPPPPRPTPQPHPHNPPPPHPQASRSTQRATRTLGRAAAQAHMEFQKPWIPRKPGTSSCSSCNGGGQALSDTPRKGAKSMGLSRDRLQASARHLAE